MKWNFFKKNFVKTTEPQEALRFCDNQGCSEGAPYKAPKNRNHVGRRENRDYYWFCMEHVRLYNLQWNYYEGMSEEEISHRLRDDITWQRPTWPLGSGWAASFRAKGHQNFKNSNQKKGKDPFGFFKDWSDHHSSFETAPNLDSKEQESLTQFKLSYPYTFDELRKQYRILVKKYHPDRNGGCRQAEERLKDINEAYQILKKHLSQLGSVKVW